MYQDIPKQKNYNPILKGDNLSLDKFIIIGVSPFLVFIVTPLEIEDSFTVLEPSLRKNFSLRFAFEPLIP